MKQIILMKLKDVQGYTSLPVEPPFFNYFRGPIKCFSQCPKILYK